MLLLCWLEFYITINEVLRVKKQKQTKQDFSNFLARITFVLESLPEAKNPGQDAIFGDFVFISSNFWHYSLFARAAGQAHGQKAKKNSWVVISVCVFRGRRWSNKFVLSWYRHKLETMCVSRPSTNLHALSNVSRPASESCRYQNPTNAMCVSPKARPVH